MDVILEDLERRGLKVAAFVCETEDGKLQVLSYDDRGLVRFLSDPVARLSINERLQGHMVRPIVDIGRKTSG